jgi:1,4-alpha-glucan branching enzyme
MVSGSSVHFRLFFPDAGKDPSQYVHGGPPRIQRIQVTGDFQRRIGGQDWDSVNAPEMELEDHPQGLLYSYCIPDLPEDFYQYKYFVTFENGTTRWCGDPCTRYVGTHNENAAFVVGGNTATVEPIGERLRLRDLVIYELMIDDFTAGYRGGRAPVDAVRDKIDYLRNLGVNAVEFMPWTAWRSSAFSWGYDPFLFFAVENRYIEDPANPLDRLCRLKVLVTELHRHNIHVIMDGVFNHVDAGQTPGTGFPYHWLYQDPGDSPFIGGYAGGGYLEDLDYHNACTRQFILDVCRFWLDTYQLDGIRFDYTLGLDRPGDTSSGISELIGTLGEHLEASGRENVSLIIEHLTDDRYAAIDATNRIGATGCWYDPFLYDVPRQAIDGHVDTGLLRVLDTNRGFASGKGPVTYVENHDHSTLINRAGGRERWWKAQTPLIALLTTAGAPLIHNGQEFGEDYYLPSQDNGRVKPRPLRWENVEDSTGQRLLALHRRLIEMRKGHPALRSADFYPRHSDERDTGLDHAGYGVDESRDVVIYHRWGVADDGVLERFIIVLSFSADDQNVDIPFSTDGVWHDLLNETRVEVEDNRLRGYPVNSNWGRVFYKKG